MLLIALLSGVMVFFLVLLFLEYFTRDRTKVARKVKGYSGAGGIEDTGGIRGDLVENFMAFARYIGQNMPSTKAIEIKMQQAGFPLLGSEFLAVMVSAGLAFGILAMMFTLQIRYAIVFTFLGMLLVWSYLQMQIARRKKDFTNQLGDALGMMANAMRSGFSFIQAMELIAKEMRPPISFEFFKTLAEIRLGADLETALQHMNERMQSADLDLAVTAVLIQRQVGGNLAQILDMISQTINERIKMQREIKTLTAQGRLSGWILAILPFALAAILTAINPSYLLPLVENPIGYIAIGGALFMEAIGILVIRRIITLDA